MALIGAYEAKTHLARLLDRVAKGERITIARHGRPVALLQPVDQKPASNVRGAIEEIRKFRRGRRLEGISIRDMIEEGRR